uniref:Ribosomal RNA-processing protein 8 n=1 Tax=Amazona collaria TaxID=241587 RepID=A0A8B9FXG2_9PSIT
EAEPAAAAEAAPGGAGGGAAVPLADESVDVAVFCLALMGTNLQEILEEANRVLKLGGTLMVAEVASRFEDMRAFMSAMAQLGFKSVSKVNPQGSWAGGLRTRSMQGLMAGSVFWGARDPLGPWCWESGELGTLGVMVWAGSTWGTWGIWC